MDSHAPIMPLRRSLMGWNALLKTELSSLSRSWVLRGWLIALALSGLFTVGVGMAANRGAPIAASGILATQLTAFLVIWSTVIIVLSAGSVSLETEMIADSILSRPCTRTQYITAKLASRAGVVLGAYGLFATLTAFIAIRYGLNDVTMGNVLTAVGIVGLAILMLVTLGVALSVALNNTIVAVVAMLLLWYVAAPVFSFLGADYLSPTSLARNLPRVLKDSNAPQIVEGKAAQTSITLTFSKPMDETRAQTASNYRIEIPDGQTVTPSTAAYDGSRSSVVLTAAQLPAGQRVKVAASGVTDRAGNELTPVASSATVDIPAGESSASKSADSGSPASGKKDGELKPESRAPDRAPLRVTQCTATGSSIRVAFSGEVDRQTAEIPTSYIVESPPGQALAAAAASCSEDGRSVLLSGMRLPPGEPVKVTVKDVRGKNGALIARDGSTAEYSEVTAWKYLLGFGLPALLSTLAAVVWFSRRDL